MYKVITIILGLSIAFSIFAEEGLSKEEKKVIKKELKQFKKNPELYVAKIDAYEDEIDIFKADVQNKLDVINRQNQEITDSREMIIALNARIAELEGKVLERTVCGEMPTGKTYRVQIGLYEFFNLSVDVQNEVRTLMLEQVDGQNRYSIGNFSTVEEATQFKLDMMQMGINDAFVSQYLNGERNMSFDARFAE